MHALSDSESSLHSLWHFVHFLYSSDNFIFQMSLPSFSPFLHLSSQCFLPLVSGFRHRTSSYILSTMSLHLMSCSESSLHSFWHFLHSPDNFMIQIILPSFIFSFLHRLTQCRLPPE